MMGKLSIAMLIVLIIAMGMGVYHFGTPPADKQWPTISGVIISNGIEMLSRNSRSGRMMPTLIIRCYDAAVVRIEVRDCDRILGYEFKKGESVKLARRSRGGTEYIAWLVHQ